MNSACKQLVCYAETLCGPRFIARESMENCVQDHSLLHFEQIIAHSRVHGSRFRAWAHVRAGDHDNLVGHILALLVGCNSNP